MWEVHRRAGLMTVALLATVAASCSSPASTIASTAIGPSPSQTRTRTTEATSEVTDTRDTWIHQTFPDLGLSFSHPADWTLTVRPAGEGPDPSMPIAAAFELTHPGSHVLVAFRPVGSNANMMGTGMPAGEFVGRGSIVFLGADIEKQALVFEGKTKVLVYGPAEIAQTEYGIRADALGSDDYVALAIPPELEAEIDEILSSFERIR